METRDYANIAEQYCRDVVAGDVLASRLVVKACERHLSDLVREKDRTFPYRFDADAAARACSFVELMPHTKGKWAKNGEDLVLEPWQVFVTASAFGWLRKANGLRRFRTVYIEVPRKNGKSSWSGGVGLFMLLADDEYGAEVYSGASKLDQAREVFSPAWNMVHSTPELQDHFGVELGGTKKNPGPIHCLKRNSKFEPVVGKPGDGASPSCAIVDEYHEHKSDKLYDTMQTGMGAREQPLMWVITTAGDNISGPCYALHQDVERILDGSMENDQLFGIIYGIDEDDDWKTEEALRKANPNYGVSLDPVWLREKAWEAQKSSRKQGTFKTKHCNVWLQARSGWMNMEAWNSCSDPELMDERFEGEPAWVGIDLSSKIDITSNLKLFRRQEEDGEDHYYLFGRHYLPETRVEHPDRRHYQGWVTDGHLIATPGDVIDHRIIREDVFADAERFRIVTLGYDPYGATQLAVSLQEAGITVLEIPQTVKYLSDPMKWVEALIMAGRLHHDGNPVMNWMMSNVTARVDANDNVFPRKDQNENKIDGPVALIIAMCVALRAQEEKQKKPRIRTL